MKISALVYHRLSWLNLPGAVLLALLQRTPAVRVVATAEQLVASSPLGDVLRSAVAVAASLGAIHSMAGATTLSTNSHPSPLSATVGTPITTVVYSVLGTQGPPASWTIGGSIPPGVTFSGLSAPGIVNIANNAYLTLAGTPTTAGAYSVTLKAWESSSGKGNFSPTYTYVINVSAGATSAPTITTQPTGQTVTAGGSVTFTAAASGSPTPTYQWNFNGAAISGATSASYTISSAQAGNAGSYTVTATNSAGSATSSAATLTVNAATSAPSITTQPASQSATAGGSVTFTAAASGSPTPTYQWNFNGAAISGATSASYTISSAQAGNAGSYTVTATNSAGSVTSSAATLTVNAATSAPSITTQPASQSATAGGSVTFTAAASGSPTPTYQWNFNGAAISGATSASYTISSAQAGNAGSYTVTATNSAGSVTSSAATLTVNAATSAPSITTQPASQSATAGGSVTFTAAASGSPTPTYQWNFNGAAISGATSASYTISSAQAGNAGSYTVTATNSAGSATSSAATLTVIAAGSLPVINTQPVSQNMALGSTVVFSVDATNASSFQWKLNGVVLVGKTNAVLVISNLTAANAGNYTCVVANGGASVTTTTAILTVGNFTAADTGHLVNVSVLSMAGPGSKVLTVGAVIGPAGFTSPLPLVVRAVGPTLGLPVAQGGFAVPGVLADPVLTVFSAGNPTPIATNNNWGGTPSLTAAFGSVGAFPLPAASLDSAFVAVNSGGLAPGGYTVQVTDGGGATGTVLAEVYDAGDANRTATTPRLINLSTLTSIDAGSSLTAGFVLRGSTSRTLLIRGIGPTLGLPVAQGGFEVPNTMVDPKLELFNGASVKIAENDNWGGDSQLITTMASVGAFGIPGATSKDAVLLITLSPGSYSARVSDTAGAAGTAIVEIYEVP